MHEHIPPPLAPRPLNHQSARVMQTDPDKVWVDAYFYGFYIDKARLPAFQRSLQANQASPRARPQVAT